MDDQELAEILELLSDDQLDAVRGHMVGYALDEISDEHTATRAIEIITVINHEEVRRR